MTTKIVVINGIEKETEKAVLISANGQTWLPKSQIIRYFENDKLPAMAIEIPEWLWWQKKGFFVTTDLRSINQYMPEGQKYPESI